MRLGFPNLMAFAALGGLFSGAACGEEIPSLFGSLVDAPHVAINYRGLVRREQALSAAPAAPTTPRARLGGMPNGYIVNPVDIQYDSDPGITVASSRSEPEVTWMSLAFGQYNPFLDRRAAEDPATLGYYKLSTQYQVFEDGSASLCLDLQALAPGGVQWGGVPEGRTTLMPTIAWYQELAQGAALQGFVGPRFSHDPVRASESLGTGVRYGMALQCPLNSSTTSGHQQYFFTLQALGRMRVDGAAADSGGAGSAFDLVPGVHWRVNNNCWMNFGVNRYNFLSCSWQF